MKIITREKSKRPPCPECGGQPMSHGLAWVCKTCGRSYQKLFHPRRVERTMQCPHCQSMHVIKNGSVRLVCADCGRSFSKITPLPITEQGGVRIL